MAGAPFVGDIEEPPKSTLGLEVDYGNEAGVAQAYRRGRVE